MKALFELFSTLVVFIFNFIPACCRKCDSSCTTTDLCFLKKRLDVLFCFIALAAAPLFQMVYVQDLRRHMTTPRVTDPFLREIPSLA